MKARPDSAGHFLSGLVGSICPPMKEAVGLSPDRFTVIHGLLLSWIRTGADRDGHRPEPDDLRGDGRRSLAGCGP